MFHNKNIKKSDVVFWTLMVILFFVLTLISQVVSG